MDAKQIEQISLLSGLDKRKRARIAQHPDEVDVAEGKRLAREGDLWRFSEERAHCSKAAAGTWAHARGPSLTAARDALRQRAGDPVRIAPREIGRLLMVVRTRIALKRVAPD